MSEKKKKVIFDSKCVQRPILVIEAEFCPEWVEFPGGIECEYFGNHYKILNEGLNFQFFINGVIFSNDFSSVEEVYFIVNNIIREQYRFKDKCA